MANDKEQFLQLLNQRYSSSSEAEVPATIQNLNAQYEKDPGAFASQGLVRDTMRLIGQVPAGFLEGFTTIETDFIPPRSEAEHIARSIGSLGGFIGYVPNPVALGAKAGLTLGSKGLAKKYIGKGLKDTAVDKLEREAISKMSKTELAKTIDRMGGTNVWKLGSVPMHGANLAMKFISPRVAPSLNKLLASSKYLKPTVDKAGKVVPNRFLTAENVISTGKGAMHLGLASSIASTGVNPFQWSERIQEAIPSFIHGSIFGAGFKSIGNIGLAMKGMVVNGQPTLAAKVLQATAGSLWQGLPATMRDATTSEQVYEYLLGAWFGFHEMPWTSHAGAKTVNKVAKDFTEGGPHWGASLFHVRNTPEQAKQFEKIHGKSFEEYYGIDAIRKNYIPEYAEAIEANLREIAHLDPRSGWDDTGRQYAGDTKYKTENNVEITVPVYWRNPYSRTDVENFKKVAQYDAETGSIVIDPFQLKPAIDHVLKNGFKPTEPGVIGFSKSVFKDKYAERELALNFLLNHEAFHREYRGNENLATAVALAQTLGKGRLNRIPKKLLDGLDGASKVTYDEYIRRFDTTPASDANRVPGAEVIIHFGRDKVKRGVIKKILTEDEMTDRYQSKYRVEYLDGDQIATARVPKSFITEVLPPRKGEVVSTPQKDVKTPSRGSQELKKVSDDVLSGKSGKAVDTATGEVVEVSKPEGQNEKPFRLTPEPEVDPLREMEQQQAERDAYIDEVHLKARPFEEIAKSELKGETLNEWDSSAKKIFPEQYEIVKNEIADPIKIKGANAIAKKLSQGPAKSKELSRYIAKAIEQQGQTIALEENAKIPGLGRHIDLRPNEHLIKLSPLIGKEPLEKQTRILQHELIHALTASRIKGKNSNAKELEAIYKMAHSRIKDSSEYKEYLELFNEFKETNVTPDRLQEIGGKYYGFTNSKEFVAEIFTRPEFQEVLKGIELSKTDKKTITAWDKIIDAIRRIVGIPKGKNDLLDAALTSGSKIIDPESRLLKGQEAIEVPKDQSDVPFSLISKTAPDYSKYKDPGWNTMKAVGRRQKLIKHTNSLKNANPGQQNRKIEEQVVFDLLKYTEGFTSETLPNHPLGGEIVKAITALDNVGYKWSWSPTESLFRITTKDGRGWSNRPEASREAKLSSKDNANRNVQFGQGNKKEVEANKRLTPEQKDIAKKKASVQTPAQGDVTTGTPESLLEAPKPKPKTPSPQKSTVDREAVIPQETVKNLEETKAYKEAVKRPGEEVYPKEATPEEITFLEHEDDYMAHRWSSIVRNKFGNLDAVEKEALMQGLADRYESMSEQQFKDGLSKFKTNQLPFSEIEKQSAVTYFENHPRVRAIEFDANGKPFINPKKFIRNASVHRIYNVRKNPNRMLYIDKQTETALRARIPESELGSTDMTSLRDMVISAGLESTFSKPISEGGFGIKLAEYHDFMRPSGKYSRFLLKYPKNAPFRKGPNGEKWPPEIDYVKNFHSKQMRLMMGDAYLNEKYEQGQHNKANKYFGQLFTDANFIKTDKKMEVAFLNDDAWIQGMHPELKSNLYGSGDIKPKTDGAIVFSNKLMNNTLDTAGIPSDGTVRNIKPVIVHIDPKTGDRYIFKGNGFAEPDLQKFMDNNKLDMVVLKSSGKVFQLGNENVRSNEVELSRVLRGDDVQSIINKHTLNMDSIGIIKEEKAKTHATASTQMNDGVSNSKDFTTSFIDAFLTMPTAKLSELSDPNVIYDQETFRSKLFEALGVKRTDAGLEYLGAETAKEYINLIASGMNPWNPILRDQTMHYMRHFLLDVAQPKVEGASYVTLSPDWHGSLRERSVSNGQIIPGDVRLPSSMAGLKQRIGDLMVFDYMNEEYVPFMDYYYQKGLTKKYLGDKDVEVTLYDAHEAIKERSDGTASLVVLFQRSPKQKPEDTVLVSIDSFLKKEYGHVAKMNTLDASIASESDWDGDAGSFIPKVRKEMINELTRGVLDKDGNLRVGSPEVGKGDYTGLDIRDYNRYTAFNKKLYTASQSVGKVVNGRTMFTSAVNAKIDADVGGRKVQTISRNSDTFVELERLTGSHVQQVVDAAGSNIDPRVLSPFYADNLRSEFFGDKKPSAISRSIYSWLTAHISDAIRGTNPKHWGTNGDMNTYDLVRAKYKADAYRNDPELAVGLIAFKDAFKKRKGIKDYEAKYGKGSNLKPSKKQRDNYENMQAWLKEYEQLNRKSIDYTRIPAEHLELLVDGWGKNRITYLPYKVVKDSAGKNQEIAIPLDIPVIKIKNKDLFNSTPRQQIMNELKQLPDTFIPRTDTRVPPKPSQLLSVIDKQMGDRDRFNGALHNISIGKTLELPSEAINGDMFDRLPERFYIDGKRPLKDPVYKRAFDRMMLYKLVDGALVYEHPSGMATESQKTKFYSDKAENFKNLMKLNNINLKELGFDTKAEIDKFIKATTKDREGYHKLIEELWDTSNLHLLRDAFLLAPFKLPPSKKQGKPMSDADMAFLKRGRYLNFVKPNKFMFTLLERNPQELGKYNSQWNNTFNEFHSGSKIPNVFLNALEANPTGPDRSRHNFPYETNTKPIMHSFGKPLTQLKPYQQAFFENAFSEIPGLKANWMEFVTGLIGKPHIESNAEVQQIMTVLRKYMDGKPFMSLLDRQLMPEVLGKKMLSWDRAFSEHRPFQLLGTASLNPLSSLQRAKQPFVDAHFNIDAERAKMTTLLRDVFYDFSNNSIARQWYGRKAIAPEHEKYIDRFKALVEDFRTGKVNEKEIHDIAVKTLEFKNLTKEEYQELTPAEKTHRELRYKEAKLKYDLMDEVQQAYIDHVVGRVADINKFVYENYWENKAGNKISVKRSFHKVYTYMYPKWIARQKEIYANASADKREAELETLRRMEHQYTVLKAEDVAGLINQDNPRINKGYQNGYFHRTWKDTKTRVAYEQQAMEERIANLSPEEQAKARKEFMDVQKKRIEEQEQKPDADFLYSDDVGSKYSLFRFNPAAEQRSGTPTAGYRTDMPGVMMEYFGKTLNQSVKMDAGLKARLEVDAFMKRMRDQWKLDVKEPENYKRLEEFMHSYIMDNLGYTSALAKQPRLMKYVFAKLTGKKPEEAPWDYESPYHTDVTVMEKWNARRIKQGKDPLPMDQLAKIAQAEGKFQLMALLAHPKFSLTNMFTGTINTMTVGGIKRFKRAGELLNNEDHKDFREFIDAEGILPDMLQSEFGVTAGTLRGRYPAFFNEAQQVLGGKTSTKEKLAEIHELAKEHGVPEDMVNKAAYFMRGPEQWLRKRAFVVGYQIGQEQGLSGDALKDHARKFVMSTQYLYHNAVRPEYMRTSLGKITTRFMSYMFNTVALNTQLREDAKNTGYRKGTDEYKRYKEWMGSMTVMLALASLYPYSLFDSGLPPHLDYMKDAAELMFGDEEDRKKAFFGTYGLNTITSPSVSKLMLRPLLTLMNQDIHQYLDRELWTLFPFGRFAKSSWTTFNNPYWALETWTGIPLHGFAKEKGKIQRREKKQERALQFPG